jgi:alpha-glucosidase
MLRTAGFDAKIASPGLTCVINLGGDPAVLPGYGTPLLASAPLAGRDGAAGLPVDAAAWFRTPEPGTP